MQREVADILLREQIEKWREDYKDIFSVLYCVGEETSFASLSVYILNTAIFVTKILQ